MIYNNAFGENLAVLIEELRQQGKTVREIPKELMKKKIRITERQVRYLFYEKKRKRQRM